MTNQKKKNISEAKIVRRQNLTKDLWKIWLSTSEHFEFKPGQYCTIGLNGVERPYSIVSSPKEKLIELFLELLPPPLGVLTPLLYEAKEGDMVTIRPRAKGLFTFKEEYDFHVMISTVTGVAPFVSMVRNYLINPSGKDNFLILEGASFIDEFGYHEELQEIASKNENIKYIPTCSKPEDLKNKNWNGEKGRVNNILSKYVNSGLKSKKTLVYACGHPEMVKDVKRQVSDEFNVIEEKFWKS
jgi:ferredoxin--NADP+ reductase